MKSSLVRTWAEIDLDALTYNYHVIKERVGNAGLIGIVKADAYGHGAVQLSKHLETLGADYLAVSSIDEAIELRIHGIQMPIMILGYTPAQETNNLIAYNITQSVTNIKKAIAYQQEAQKIGKSLRVHLQVDTGMSRLGIQVEENFDNAIEELVEICQLDWLEVEGIFTHFAVSDERDEHSISYTNHQFELFEQTCQLLEKEIGYSLLKHCANSGAIAHYPNTYMDMVRPGILMYGCTADAIEMGLKPVMSLKTTVSTIKNYAANTAISYGGIYVTEKETRIAVLPIGYADGLSRGLSNHWSVYTDHGYAKQVGRICMDMCMVDVTDIDIHDGETVEIFGSHQTVTNLAKEAGTIPHEMTCNISKRVPRKYIQNGQIIYEELLLRSK